MKWCKDPVHHRLYHALGNCCPCIVVYAEEIAGGRKVTQQELKSIHRALMTANADESTKALRVLALSNEDSAKEAMVFLGKQGDLYVRIQGYVRAQPKPTFTREEIFFGIQRE